MENDLYKFACMLLDESSKIACKYFRNNILIDTKAGNFPVTVADREIEYKLRQLITDYYPDHNIIGEEFNAKQTLSPYTWVIDPIDGTVAFTTGRPSYTTLLALLKDGIPVFGIINQPNSAERFVGVVGQGSWLNGQKINCSSTTALTNARLSATTPYMFSSKEFEVFNLVKKHVKVCSWGGDAYAYGLLASGHIDVIMESELQYYDVAALIPIITESGGVITNWSGQMIDANFSGQCLASANALLHQEVISLILKNHK